MKRSLKRRFFFTLILPVLLALVTCGIAGFLSARHEIDEVYDAQLSHSAKILLSLVEQQLLQPNEKISIAQKPHINFGHNYEKHIAIRIWKNDELLFETPNSKHFGNKHIIAGFSNKTIDDTDWRFFVLPDPEQNITVEVAEEAFVRDDIISKILMSVFLPVLLLFPLLPLLFWLGLRFGLRPLDDISSMVSQRTAKDLTAIPVEKAPSEILPLAHAINLLLGRVETALSAERRLSDLAAHELRTPLAVIKTQAQTLFRARDEQERSTLAKDLEAGINRASIMVSQLLSLARLGHDNVPLQPISLNEIARNIIAELLPLAEQKQQQLCLLEKSSITITANQEILAVIIRNLLDNAIKYTPAGGSIVTVIDQNQSRARLCVEDSGPGIPEDALTRVRERFYRVPGNTQTGSGLGLAIVARAAEIIGADLSISNRDDAQGLRVCLKWR